MPQKTEIKYPAEGGRMDATKGRISNSGRGRENGCHIREKNISKQWQREEGWMPQKTEMKYPTVAEGGWMPQKTEMEHPAVAEGGRMDATKHRNNISSNGTGREDGCQKS